VIALIFCPRCIQYFGHITRGSAGQLALTVLEGIMEGLRHQGIIIIIIFISRKNKQKHCLHRQSDKKTEREATREARRSLNWPPM